MIKNFFPDKAVVICWALFLASLIMIDVWDFWSRFHDTERLHIFVCNFVPLAKVVAPLIFGEFFHIPKDTCVAEIKEPTISAILFVFKMLLSLLTALVTLAMMLYLTPEVLDASTAKHLKLCRRNGFYEECRDYLAGLGLLLGLVVFITVMTSWKGLERYPSNIFYKPQEELEVLGLFLCFLSLSLRGYVYARCYVAMRKLRKSKKQFLSDE